MTDPLQLCVGVRVTLSQEPLSDLFQLLLLTLPVPLIQLRLLLSVANPLLQGAAPEGRGKRERKEKKERERSNNSEQQQQQPHTLKCPLQHRPVVFGVVSVVVVVLQEFFESFGLFQLRTHTHTHISKSAT